MKKYIGKKWKQLTSEQQENLLSNANASEKVGDCIIDLSEKLSVAGRVISTEDENYIEINDDAILYDPNESVIVENEKFKGLITLKEAAKKYSKEESTIRGAIRYGTFIENQDCIKFGTTWVFDEEVLDKYYSKKIYRNK